MGLFVGFWRVAFIVVLRGWAIVLGGGAGLGYGLVLVDKGFIEKIIIGKKYAW